VARADPEAPGAASSGSPEPAATPGPATVAPSSTAAGETSWLTRPIATPTSSAAASAAAPIAARCQRRTVRRDPCGVSGITRTARAASIRAHIASRGTAPGSL
jgi:hypothetical protein